MISICVESILQVRNSRWSKARIVYIEPRAQTLNKISRRAVPTATASVNDCLCSKSDALYT